MNDLENTTPETPEREKRLDEAALAILEARDSGDMRRVRDILAENLDLLEELEAMLEAEEDYLGLQRPAHDVRQALRRLPRLDHYEILETIDRGGYGEVILARHRFLGREVAIKLLHTFHAHQQSVMRRFLEEALIASHLEHPGITPIHEIGWMPDGRIGLVMKRIKGRNLAVLLRERASPADRLPQFVGIFLHICQTVAYAHVTRAVLHRDLKPGNVMVGEFEEVQVMDWGLSKVAQIAEEPARSEPGSQVAGDNDSAITQAGTILGTPAFMSPEQARGDTDAVGPASDVFGLGAILCQILTGQPPRTEADFHNLIPTHDLTPAFTRLDSSGADPELIALAKRCLATNPADRPADAAAVAEVVAGYLNGLPEKVQQQKLLLAEEQRRQEVAQLAQLGRRRVRRTLLVSGLILLAGTLAVGYWQLQEHHEKSQQATAKEAVRTAREKDISAALTALDEWIVRERWAEARERLAYVETRMAEGGTEGLRDQVKAAEKDLEFIRAFDVLRQRRLPGLTLSLGKDDRLSLDCSTALENVGIDLSNPDKAATQIRASRIRPYLMACLDDWASSEKLLLGRSVLRIAQKASDDGWANQIRDAEIRRLPVAMQKAMAEVDIMSLRAVEIESLALLALRIGGDSERLLRQGLEHYRDDLWLNHLMAIALAMKANKQTDLLKRRLGYEEALGYARTAAGLATRAFQTDLGQREIGTQTAMQQHLGFLLVACNRFGEAELAYARALQAVDQMSFSVTTGVADKRQKKMLIGYNLAWVRLLRGDLPGAEAICQQGLEIAPRETALHRQLGIIQLYRGQAQTAETAFVNALKLAPKSPVLLLGLASSLQHQGRMAESYRCWGQAQQAAIEARSDTLIQAALPTDIAATMQVWHTLVRNLDQIPGADAFPAFMVPVVGRSFGPLSRLEREALPACIAGTYKPRSEDDRLLAAELCLTKGLPLIALNLFEQSFASDDSLLTRTSQVYPAQTLRSMAGRAAVLAACAHSVEATQRTALCRKALEWLRQEMTALQRELAADRLKAIGPTRLTCSLWLHGPDLARLRDPDFVKLLPDTDQLACEKFWNEVQALWRDTGG